MTADEESKHNGVQKRTCIVVARHGERLDYVMRDAGKNWLETSDTPWNPPLTSHGHEQANRLGKKVKNALKQHGFGQISAIYSSPFGRCIQTAMSARESISDMPCSVRVEEGLAESLNQNWYRSWCLPGSDGTWGYHPTQVNGEATSEKQVGQHELHASSKSPVQGILKDFKQKTRTDDELKPFIDEDYNDMYSIDTPYCWGNFETRREQQERMYSVLKALAKEHVGESILLVSHGGPVTHLYERISGQHWSVHGESSYCCFSIYEKGEHEENWKSLVVNEPGSTTIEKHID